MSIQLLAAKLLELRQQSGYSQKEVADYLGLTREGYGHYERNSREPNLEVIVKLCKLYQIKVSELINEETILVSLNPLAKTGTSYISSEDISDHNDIIPSSTKQNPKITNNINHFLKLFTGKNTSLDLTDISKEDISLLAQYKKLSKQNQKEVQEFIKFKHFISKNKQ